MKNTVQKNLASALFVLLLAAIGIPASAQKLNNIQEGSVWAPANVKVDAKLTEWNNTFQAFNKTTNIYYTMANDGANLYFIMKSADQSNNNKIIGGGINITINIAGKKSDKDAFVLIFPVINPANLRAQIMSFRGGGGGPPGAPGAGGRPDSAALAGMRKKAVSAFKEVKLIGFKDIPDSVISVYNEYGIKAFVDFDDKGALIMEMAVPLKYFYAKTGAGESFAYNIKLNGIQIDAIFPGARAMMEGAMGGGFGGGGQGGGQGGGFGGGGMGAGGMGGGGGQGMPRGMADMAGMLSPTDFWGKYVLAKKP